MSLQDVELREIEEVTDAGGDQVVVFFRLHGTARASGIPRTSA
jgi:hypothetical protein